MTTDDNTNKIIELIQSAAAKKKARPRKPPTPPPTPLASPGVIYVAGDGNVVAHGSINTHPHYHQHPPARPRVIVKTGEGVVSASEKATLRDLVEKWMQARAAVKKTPRSLAAAGSSFNGAMKANSYAELRSDQMEAARKWLPRQTATLNAMPSAAKQGGDRWRAARYAGIKARCKNQLADEFAYVAYTQQHFGKTSLTDLADKELERTYRYIMGLRPV